MKNVKNILKLYEIEQNFFNQYLNQIINEEHYYLITDSLRTIFFLVNLQKAKENLTQQ